MPDLAEFLTARLEEEAESLADAQWGDANGTCYECGTNQARELRKVEAGRKILAEVIPEIIRMDRVVLEEYGYSPDEPSQHLPLLRIMAAVYRDHPDYDVAWEPEDYDGSWDPAWEPG